MPERAPFILRAGDHHTPCDVRWLSELGVGRVLASEGPLAPEMIELYHRFGIKVIGRWPEWEALGLCRPQFLVRNWRGETNSRDLPINAGPSYWYPDAALCLHELECERGRSTHK